MDSSGHALVRPQTSSRVLVIMAKAPRPGSVKTRLISILPIEAVTAFYRCLLDDTLGLARSLPPSLTGVDISIMCPEPDVSDLMGLADNRASVVGQKGDGLAAGLTSVFAHFSPDYQRGVIAFNSDSPHLPASILKDAFEKLAAHDLVVGPTHDGGYYLVGAKSFHPTLFADDGMSTVSALDTLLARAHVLELTVAFTDSFYDIDVADDLVRLAADLRHAPARAPRTAAWLEEWGTVLARLQTRPGNL